MKATTEQLVSALRVLSVEMHSEDGVANAVVAEAADRLTAMANLVARHVEETKDDIQQMAGASDTLIKATAKIQSLRERIKQLEAGDTALTYSIGLDLQKENEALKQHVSELENRLRALWDKLEGERKYYEDRIKRLEEAGDALADPFKVGENHIKAWTKAKEAKL